MSSTTDGQSRERGQILVLLAGGMAALLILAALAFDVGMMLVERRDQQNAADAAALAGARYVLDSDTAAETAARLIADRNGFDDADPDEVVNVYIPPIHGTYSGFPGFIEVQIEASRPSIFGGILGRAVWPVGAYAVATNQQNLTFPFSMLALDPTACRAISVTGGGDIYAVGSVQSNSTGEDCSDGSNTSFARTGGSTINIGEDIYCRAAGAIKDEGSGSMTCTQAPGSFALPDPLAGLPEPAKPSLAAPMVFVGPGTAPAQPPKWCPGRADGFAPVATAANTCVLGSPSGTYSGLAWILSPGLYPGGLEVSADTTAYLLPGIYWIGGDGIRVAGNGWIVSIDEATQVLDPSTSLSVSDPSTLAWEPDRDALAPPQGLGGVMLYNSDDPMPGGPIFQDGSGATMKLMPLDLPESDPRHIYNNIVIFQDRSLDTPGDDLTLNGASSETAVGGLIYLPAGQVKLNGNGGTLTLGQVIADEYNISGDGLFYITESDLFESIIVAAGLVE